ncbi:two-component sensor histidine kinase [Streptomyces sp. ISL-98]|uniref:sensor histidine kinase n=1 Tax=Streptomyces sp. ISL-98 TaxID=2819192 RepID=UPI001BE979B2|nr:histidine kinase [Streptomyces sp. ISL-98]MBT2507705.1 two-component sensor histidine kinase [Streptomyces sp. ISL-98]
MIRPLLSTDAYRGWIYAFLGAAMSLPPLLLALVAAPPKWPAELRFVGFVVALCAMLVAMGSPRAARRGSVRLADRILGADLPAPPGTPTSPWADRLRTSVYLVAHMAIGSAVIAVTCLLAFMAVVFVSVWLSGGGPVASFGLTVRVEQGWRGLWTLAACAGCLALAGYVTVGGAAALRLLASALLGHRAAERLAAVEQRMNQLAQRNRLAQELHDSIGHTLTASTIQAAVAGELMDRDPEAARRAMNSIEETSRAAMDDLDHVLGVLREGHAPTTPQRTLADLGPLMERVRQTGAGLHVETAGDLAHVPATVSREAYRIIQEGLTNALRHSNMTGISLHITARHDVLEVELINPVDTTTHSRPGREPGHGLTGIAERVRLLRGEVSAGPTDDPGGTHWRLAARIPLRSAP